MTALQIWLQNHNRRLTQDAIDEALMEYIDMIERELESNARQLAQYKAVIEQQKETIAARDKISSAWHESHKEQSTLIEQLAGALEGQHWMNSYPARNKALAAYAKYKEK